MLQWKLLRTLCLCNRPLIRTAPDPEGYSTNPVYIGDVPVAHNVNRLAQIVKPFSRRQNDTQYVSMTTEGSGELARIVGAVVTRGAPWLFEVRSDGMQSNPDQMVDIILNHGPFQKDLVMTWPEDIRKDYFELFAIDLAELGFEKFKLRTRFLGEVYLLSFGKPIANDPVLFEAWRSLTGNDTPPAPPEFKLI